MDFAITCTQKQEADMQVSIIKCSTVDIDTVIICVFILLKKQIYTIHNFWTIFD